MAKGCNAVVYSARWSKSSLAAKEEKVAESSSVDITNSSPVDKQKVVDSSSVDITNSSPVDKQKVVDSSSIDITNSSPVDESSNSVLEDKERLTVQNVEVKTEPSSDENTSEDTKIEKATSEDAQADLPTNSVQNPNKAKKSGENTDDSVSWIREFITIYNL